MAVTINSSPGLHTPAYNEQYFVASSTNYALTNFRYVCNVRVDGLITTEKISARPDNNKVYFNPQRTTEAYVTNTFNKDAYQIERANSSIKSITVGIDEEYGSSPATYAGTSASYYVWNAAYSAIGYKSFTYSATTLALPLTTQTTKKIYSGQKYAFLYWHRGFSTQSLYYMMVYCYNPSGALIQTVKIQNNYNGYSAPLNGIIYANCTSYGLELIKSTQPGDIISQSSAGALIPATTSYYDIGFVTAGLSPSSDNFRFVIDSYCSKYDKVSLNFLNRMGGYDWQVFNMIKRNVSEFKRTDYKKIPFELSASLDYTYDLTKSDTYNYATVITNKLILNSGWLTETESTLLLDLLGSPDIKYEDENGTLYSVQVTDKNYEVKKKVNDKMINITVNLEYSYEDIRQRG